MEAFTITEDERHIILAYRNAILKYKKIVRTALDLGPAPDTEYVVPVTEKSGKDN